jgi:uncharacterized protein (TIGR00106 family)
MKGRVMAEISIVPVGTKEPGLSQYVAACLDVLAHNKDISYRLTPMGTVLEGPVDLVLDAIAKMHEVPFGMGVKRVVTTIKIDERRDKSATMEGKMESVRKIMPSVKD